jgi:hypothetical protein
MSRREDIVNCIDVTIMDRSAHGALPFPHSKTFPAFRAKKPPHNTLANIEKYRPRESRRATRVAILAGLKVSVSRGEIA